MQHRIRKVFKCAPRPFACRSGMGSSGKRSAPGAADGDFGHDDLILAAHAAEAGGDVHGVARVRRPRRLQLPPRRRLPHRPDRHRRPAHRARRDAAHGWHLCQHHALAVRGGQCAVARDHFFAQAGRGVARPAVRATPVRSAGVLLLVTRSIGLAPHQWLMGGTKTLTGNSAWEITDRRVDAIISSVPAIDRQTHESGVGRVDIPADQAMVR
jgi:hypothetical protein